MNLDWLIELAEIARAQRCEAIVQLGDLGFFPRRRFGRLFLAGVELLLERMNLRLFFLEGNHDDLDALWRTKLPLVGGFAAVGERVFYLRRGQRFRWHGVRFLAVGGAHSLDRGWRLQIEQTPRTLWWPEETLSDADVARACRGGRVDVLLAHDCPAGVAIPGIDTAAVVETELNRRQLARIVGAVRPVHGLYHAHYHLRFDGRYENLARSLSVPTVGLAYEHTGRDGWTVLDLGRLAAAGDERGYREENR